MQPPPGQDSVDAADEVISNSSGDSWLDTSTMDLTEHTAGGVDRLDPMDVDAVGEFDEELGILEWLD